MIRRIYYGWYDARTSQWRLSRLPPDAPVRPSIAFTTKADLMAWTARKRVVVHWYPPLSRVQERDDATIQAGW